MTSSGRCCSAPDHGMARRVCTARIVSRQPPRGAVGAEEKGRQAAQPSLRADFAVGEIVGSRLERRLVRGEPHIDII